MESAPITARTGTLLRAMLLLVRGRIAGAGPGLRDDVGEPEAGQGGNDGKPLVGDFPIRVGGWYRVDEEVPADGTHESLDSECGSKGDRWSEKSHVYGGK